MKTSLSLRLTVSYSLLVLTVAVVLTSVSLTVFQTQYEAQLSALHRQTLEALGTVLKTETSGRLQTLYREIAVQLVGPSLSFLGPEDDPRLQAPKVLTTYQALVDLLNRHLDAVAELRVEYRSTGMSISTLKGLGWPRETLIAEDLARLTSWGVTEGWERCPDGLEAVRAFPFLGDPGQATVAVRVRFRPSVWEARLSEYAQKSSSEVSLLDPSGGLVFSAGLAPQSGEPVIVHRVSLAGGFTLVDQTLPGRLYHEAESVRLLLVLVSVGVLLAGVVLATFLAFHHSRPWKALWRRTRPLLKDELALRFLEGAPIPTKDFEELGVRPPDFPLWVWWCRLDASSNQNEARIVPYLLAEDLEARLGSRGIVRAWSGAVAAAVPEGPDGPIGVAWRAAAFQNGGHRVVLGVGPVCYQTGDLGQALTQARNRVEWSFVFPEREVFDDPALDRRPGRGFSRPLEECAQALRLAQEGAIREALDRLGYELRTEAGSSTEVRSVLGEAFRLVEDWGELPPGGITAPHLDAALQEILEKALTILRARDPRRGDRHRDLVHKVNEYVADHLAGDLSLDRLAREMGFSPGYLGTVYREVTGQPYLAAVTEQRLERAQVLLKTTQDPVHTVARAVGFQTPAYFIRQFKARFGITPAQGR